MLKTLLCIAIVVSESNAIENDVIKFLLQAKNELKSLNTKQVAGTGYGPMCQGHYMNIYIDPVTWEEARQSCNNLGGQLAKIQDAETHQMIKDFIDEERLGREIAANGKGLWIGLNDIDVEGSFVWADGEGLLDDILCNPYEGWAINEPNNNTKKNPNGQDCVQLWKARGYDWDDAYCDYTKGYICEFQGCP